MKTLFHKPCSFGSRVICLDEDAFCFKPFIYRGADCKEVRIMKLEEIGDHIYDIIKTNEEIIMAEIDKHIHSEATCCILCNQPLEEK